jgi:predicted TIM-barrel fold metal-dependent hydrolase
MSRYGMVLSLLLLPLPVRATEPEAVYKTSYRVINVHRHCGSATEAALQAELEVCDRVGVSKIVILDGGSPPGSLPAWLELRRKHPDRLIVFFKLDCARIKDKTFFDDIVRDLEKAAKQGVQGVKVWKDVGMYNRDLGGKLLKADDDRFDPFYAKCAELGLPVLIHSADPKEYWYPLTYNSFHYGLRPEAEQHYNNPEMPKWEELIRQRDALLKKHPRVKFIGAHMGSLSFDLKQLAETFDMYPNLYVDCAARQRILGRLNPPAIRDFFLKYQDRILFGTDDMVLGKGRKPGKSVNISVYPGDDPDYHWINPEDKPAVRTWQERQARMYGEYFQYFETDKVDLTDPNRSAGNWLRFAGVKLPAGVLEKLYHGNAEKLIPGLVGGKAKGGN